jgi:tetratricopeptide (TPR) repeat protein
LILEKAEGIPLFIEELTKLVLGADEKRIGKSPIPESLSGLLASQLDRLGSTRSIAQLAAIVGRDFTTDMLALAAPCPVNDIETALDQLAAAGIVVRVGREDSNVFSFRHALLRDAAYGSILEQTRRELHLRVGRLMIASFPPILAEHPELIARHLSEAGCPGDAVPFWIDAGRKAAGRYALAEAITDFELALTALAMLLPSRHHREQELQVLIELGLAIRNARGYGDRGLLEIYERARALAAEVTDLPSLASAVYGLWTHAAGKGEWRTALVLAREFQGLSQRAGDSQLELEALRLLGASAAFAGDLATARQHFEQVLARYDIGRHGPALGFDPGAVSSAYLAWTVWHLGDSENAERYATQAIAIAEAKGHPPTLAVVLSWLIFYHVCTGNIDSILEYNRRLQTVCSERDCRYWQPFGNACAEWAEFGLDGEPRHLDRMLALTGEFRERYFTSCLLLLGAEMCLKLRQTQRGLQTVASAREFIEKHDEQLWEAELHRLHAELMLQGTPERARDAGELLRCAIETARRQNARSLEGRALTSLERLQQPA